MAQPYQVRINIDALKVLIARTSGPFTHPDVAGPLGDGIRQWGLMVQARAVRNVTGYPVSWSGGVFRVMVRTGTLRSSIELEYPYQSRFQARVYVNGTHMNPGQQPGEGLARPQPVSKYAAAIEDGHGPIDLKRTMRGKVVPFFASQGSRTTGPYTARGLKPLQMGGVGPGGGTRATGIGSLWTSYAHNHKLAAKGKGPMIFEKKGGGAAFKSGGSTPYFIAFRRVGDTGWIIPAAAPRPFMRAAVEGTTDQGRRMLIAKVVPALTGGL